MKRLLALAFLLIAPAAAAQSEIILDNGTAAFSATGTWPASTAVSGFVGPNYQSHEANGAPPTAIAVDNTDAGFSVTGTWPLSTAVSGFLGANYQVHAANGEPVGAIVADNSSGSATGTWPNSTSVAGYFGANYQTHTAGTGANVFTWTLNVPSSGTYQVYGRWTAHPNRATNAKYTVNHSAGPTVVTVNMEQASAQWNLLGSFSFDAGQATISLSDDANDYVIADAVMLVPPGAQPSTATWTLNVATAGSYNVYARWTAHPNRATDAKYTVNHAGGATLATVNQEQNSGAWNLLGTFTFNAGSATVTLTDQANGYVIADAVMLAPPGAAPNTATWTPNVAQAGTYEVYARWTQNANRATNAVYAVTHATGSTNVTVNQQAGGGAWNSLGTFALNPGSAHKVTLTDQANGFVIADAIRLVPVTLQPLTSLYFIHTDHLNTPRAIYDANQQLRWKWDQQEPFGVNVPDENPAGQGAFEFPQRFPGQYADKETNLNQNYFRDYDAGLGRYVESDPIGLRGGLNTYLYVSAQALRFVDPLGLKSRVCCKEIALDNYHCYIETENSSGRSSTWGLVGGWYLNMPDCGQVLPNNRYDRGGECGPWGDCAADECVDKVANSYPNPSRYSYLSSDPNSNSFASEAVKQCKLTRPSTISDKQVPGWSGRKPPVAFPGVKQVPPQWPIVCPPNPIPSGPEGP